MAGKTKEKPGKMGGYFSTDGWAMPNLEAHSGRFTAYWPGVKSSQKLREATGAQLSALLSPRSATPSRGFSADFSPLQLSTFPRVQKQHFWLRLVLAVSIVLVLVLRSREFISIISFGT